MSRRISRSTLLTGALGVAALSWSPPVSAAHGRSAVVVLVEGPNADAISGWIEDRLSEPDSHSATFDQEEAFRGALRSRGVLPLQKAASSPARDARLVACAHAAAGETDVGGAVLVDVEKTSRATHIHVWNMNLRPAGGVTESDIALAPAATVTEEARAILALLPPAPSAPATAAAPAPASAAPAVPSAPPPLVPAKSAESASPLPPRLEVRPAIAEATSAQTG